MSDARFQMLKTNLRHSPQSSVSLWRAVLSDADVAGRIRSYIGQAESGVSPILADLDAKFSDENCLRQLHYQRYADDNLLFESSGDVSGLPCVYKRHGGSLPREYRKKEAERTAAQRRRASDVELRSYKKRWLQSFSVVAE